ncbi:MAG: DUF2520 domain-containing protein [Bacteroidales bacterium]|nr:DUF2520 domain-containing protein [Bacteroidales bacterium]
MTRIGFIGAGKVGTALGSYLRSKGCNVSGYYDQLDAMAIAAAEVTGSTCFGSIGQLLDASEQVFITVPDDKIASVWEFCRHLPVAGKGFFHCSGTLSSEVFERASEAGVHVGSAHPVCAVSSHSTGEVFSGKFFVLEGDATGIEMLKSMMMTTGNDYHVIGKADKARYHAAMVAASNLCCALAQMSEDWLSSCGFDKETAHALIIPLMKGNIDNIALKGCVEGLTGPVERNDVGTVTKHMNLLNGDDREIYRRLSLRLVSMAELKHPDNDYTNLKEVLQR